MMVSNSENNISLLREEKINIIERNTLYENNKKYILFIKLSIAFVLIITNIPIIIIDLIYGFSNKICLKIPCEIFELNMTTYLIISGFSSIFNLICCFIVLYMHNLHYENNHIILNNHNLKIVSLLFSFSQLFWNLLGVYIFMNSLSDYSSCGSFILNYLFVTLMIKLTCNLTIIFYKIRVLTGYNENMNENN